ncbi:MAG: hypothetical protein JWQ00_2803 [Noviherbaspirillum sp.]|jgi:uncharacterized lipoprotein YehR (DUF1307 family)|nr:hypothetical protein [Noviherbaspirillum sp.]
MSRAKPLTMLVSALALAVCITACQKREATAEQKGPAETAGKHIDQAAVKAGEQLNKVAEEAGKGLAKAGEKLQNAAQDAQKKE